MEFCQKKFAWNWLIWTQKDLQMIFFLIRLQRAQRAERRHAVVLSDDRAWSIWAFLCIIQPFVFVFIAVQRRSRDRVDSHGPVERLHLRQSPVLLARRLRDLAHGEDRAASTTSRYHGVERQVRIPQMDERGLGRATHRRQWRIFFQRWRELRDLSWALCHSDAQCRRKPWRPWRPTLFIVPIHRLRHHVL